MSDDCSSCFASPDNEEVTCRGILLRHGSNLGDGDAQSARTLLRLRRQQIVVVSNVIPFGIVYLHARNATEDHGRHHNVKLAEREAGHRWSASQLQSRGVGT